MQLLQGLAAGNLSVSPLMAPGGVLVSAVTVTMAMLSCPFFIFLFVIRNFTGADRFYSTVHALLECTCTRVASNPELRSEPV